MLLLRLALCLLSCAIWLPFSAASEASQRTATLVRTDTAPVIDGVLDEPAWSEGALLEPMIQTLPIEGDAPTEHTEIRLLYDRDFLYLGIRMYDSDPSALIAKQMVYDADMTSDDRINLSFDTFNDHRNAYFFQINPARLLLPDQSGGYPQRRADREQPDLPSRLERNLVRGGLRR
jgi:hypothetical protein